MAPTATAVVAAAVTAAAVVVATAVVVVTACRPLEMACKSRTGVSFCYKPFLTSPIKNLAS